LIAAQAQAGEWPGGRQVAVVLTYDDALSSHLGIAIPALDAAGLKGTFFLIGYAWTAGNQNFGQPTFYFACWHRILAR
jgi:peptidoglycan/xylan/chitin deacetylase (PgdA/CDA1 family)